MLKVNELPDFISEAARNGLTKITVDILVDGDYHTVDKTKETYVFYDEDQANDKVDEIRGTSGFIGVELKEKEAKLNKDGEETKPATYTVVAKVHR